MVISALGQNPPPALQKRSREVGPRARCNLFPCAPGRGSLRPVQRLGGMTDAEIGHVEGRNVIVEYRWAENHDDRLSALAADLVRHRAVSVPRGVRGTGFFNLRDENEHTQPRDP
jgi:hypothetical protein